MNSRHLAPLFALAAALGLSACAETHSMRVGKLNPEDFGEANRQTFAAMVVDPNPQYDKQMATSAEHAALAIERYDTDSVKQPHAIRSTATGSGGGGGGGGSESGR
jgi:hypothetical protein